VIDRVSIAITRAVLASRGNQVVRKDKDLMSDTGGKTKGRDREPDQKPPREDMENRYRTKDTPSKEREKDIQKDPDVKSDPDLRLSMLANRVASNPMMAKAVLARYPATFHLAVGMR
jgi:hypothetical protein